MNNISAINDIVEAYKAHDSNKAASLIDRLISDKAALGSNWANISSIALNLGECGLAEKSALLLAKTNKNEVNLQIQVISILAQAGRVTKAHKLAKSLHAKHPANPPLNHLLGTLQSQLGDIEPSLDSLRKTLKQWDTSGVAWMTLASLKKFNKTDTDLQTMLAVQNKVKTTKPDNYAAYLYAAAKALADIGDVQQSFKLYNKAALIMKNLRPFNMNSQTKLVDELISGYTKSSLGKLCKSGIDSEIPIFIVGYPRSGSTLVEQILTSHGDVADGGEINLFKAATMPLKGTSFAGAKSYESGFDDKSQAWKTIAEQYLHLLEERFEGKGRIVDKSLNNSYFIGLIRHIFPKSPIIWMKRTPRDAAWSCYKTFFASSLDWTWSQADIAAYFKLDDRLKNHWMDLYPDAILEVPYEELVKDKEEWIPKILSHCGLGEDENVFNFHKTDRPVLTSSVTQVRGPMTTKPIGSSDAYSEYLSEFTDNYNKK